ncbi:MAG: ribonuclease P protein component [Alphaproteobacteria bacterium]|jgi:ribonuclease P protein component|nr:ribonuclease P protein component [Alphaproteobacteria bacterium]MDP6590727.1 ribonuclease P protein component [Alphaproteobacteria bacterium]MDP6817432.1 ribonuclease P protein component [Alphaproteobacteria bacterium]|tara:strand:+ start:1313 stop:1720 length:408 start_codon:yes stop_codon:yes gene_type:complete
MAARIVRLTRRSEFLHAQAQGRKAAMPGLVLQAVRTAGQPACAGNSDGGEAMIRVGFTASRRVGGAVARNRAKRRLRAAVAHVMPGHAKAGHDYVVIARAATLQRGFADLRRDLETALTRIDEKLSRIDKKEIAD